MNQQEEFSIVVFAKQVSLGRFEVRTSPKTFEITPQTFGQKYYLVADFDSEFCMEFDDPFEAVTAVAQHRTGLPSWDRTSEKVSDYTKHWEKPIDKKFRINLVNAFIERNENCSYRELIDYFHFKHPYLMDRAEIGELLTELYTTGQLTKTLDADFIPSELQRVHAIGKKWLEET